jgi:hypothetical protein
VRLRPIFLTLSAGVLLLGACDRPKGAPKGSPTATEMAAVPGGAVAPAVPAATTPVEAAPPPQREAEPITWDQARERFTRDGLVLKTANLWRFDGGLDGFVSVGARITPVPSGGLHFQAQSADSVLRSPQSLAVEGRRFNAVLVRLTREKAGAKWDGSLFYTTAGHGEAAGFHAKPVRGANPAVGETTIMVYDMANPKKGGDDWVTSTISSLRLDLDDSADGVFVIHQIAVVSLPASADLRPAQ